MNNNPASAGQSDLGDLPPESIETESNNGVTQPGDLPSDSAPEVISQSEDSRRIEVLGDLDEPVIRLDIPIIRWKNSAGNLKEANSNQAARPDSNFSYSPELEIYTPEEMDRLSDKIASNVTNYGDFTQLRMSIGEGLNLTTLPKLAKTIRRASNDKKMLVEKYQLDRVPELKCGDNTFLVQELDSFLARTIAAGHRLTINLVLAELYYQADLLDDSISEDCRDACKEYMEKAIAYICADIRVDRNLKRFVNGKGEPISSSKNHTLSQHFRSELKKAIIAEKLTRFTRNESKLLATFRAFASETRQIKDDISVLLATAYAAEEGAFLSSADNAIAMYVGLHERDLKTNICRLTASKSLTPRIEEAIQGLQTGYETLREIGVLDNSVTLDKIIPALDRSFLDNILQAYMGFNNTSLGKGTKMFAFVNGAVALGGLSLVKYLGFQESAEALPYIGQVLGVMMNPLYTFSTFVSLAVLLDKIPDGVRNFKARRFLSRIKENER